MPTTIPGIDRIAASTILIEVGPDTEVFASKEHFATSARLCPGNKESERRQAPQDPLPKGLRDPARHPRRVRARRGPHGEAQTRGCQFEAHHSGFAARRGYKRAIVAGAHKIPRIIHVVLKNGRPQPRPLRRPRRADGQAQRPALDPHASPLRLHRGRGHRELTAA